MSREPPGLATYTEGKEHYIYGLALFGYHPNHDEDDALCISRDYMEQRGWDHDRMTATQQRLDADLYQSGRPLTMEEATRIAVEAMVEGNVPPDQAQAYAAAALAQLRAMGVTAPTYFPHYGPLEGGTP